MSTPAPLLATRGLTKDYPGVRALDRVDFDLRAGEVHVLFGENGAGKSTLISMLSGANTPSAGHIERDGEVVAFNSVHDARDHGVSAVFQEFSLIPQMTVEENLFLGAEHCKGIFLDRSDMRREAERILTELAFDLRPDRKVQHLSRAEQQMVEIAKAFRSDLSVLILDEPTASLTDHETDQLFRLIEDLTARGVGIIYITHRMAEIRRIGDRITILRDGKLIDTIGVDEADEDRLVELMTGREVGAIFPEISLAPPGEEILRLDGVSTPSGSVIDLSLSVRRGEIVGLAGLVGSGKSEAMQAAYGALPVSAGTVSYKGRDVTGHTPGAAIRDGFLYLPADRHDEGLLMVRPVRENMSLASLDVAPFRRGIFLDRGGERRKVAELAERLNLSPNQPERAVDHFSGGNQQKAMLARSLTRKVDLVVFDEPTVGVDVGTRAAIYRFILELAEAGAAVVIVSSDLPEILNLASRAYVFYRGQIQIELRGPDLTEENVLANFFERESA
ncbi:sugar ABC transporter ATP-binding protein [Ovoidimarina sediminis]|uniref:sugar ABC transporter ATP-binding protein n=1 Tax=Ovoidimarina sediminis TaxID=3079856 RepID=UPI002906BB72|nr:sugar ABC transporter ATP-binding protein [Rhodophyticola sp. MJ-SS7]MDU8945276.1 sugar ABC transporter ATP-binding protein [Rhodophyticola sp. MJ-SS7]